MKLLKLFRAEQEKHPNAFFLTGAVFLLILLRIPSLIEPSWYGDEGIYQVIGHALHNGRLLYKEIWDNKPPFLYLIYALFNGDLFFVRFTSLFFGALSVVTFFYVAKNLFKRLLPVFVSTALYSFLFGLPLFEGNIANAENFMHFPTLLALYVIVISRTKKTVLSSLLAGLLLSAAFLFKIVAIFDFAAFLVIVFIVRYYDEKIIEIKRHLFTHKTLLHAYNFLKSEVVFILSFMAPILVTVLYFAFFGAFSDYFRAVFSQNVGYVGYGNYFIIPQGFLYLKLFLLALSVLAIIRFRTLLGFSGSVIFTWIFFSLFNAFFSARPYTHYLLVFLPAFCLFAGYGIENKKIRILNGVIFIVLLFLVIHNFRLYKKIGQYYANYFQFITSQKTIEAYQAFFDRVTPRDYSIANFIMGNTTISDSIFLWSDSAQIYYLSNKLPPGRYSVAYHITFYTTAIDETKKALEKKFPKYIIDTKHTKELETFLPEYRLRYRIDDADIYERKL